jgi:5-carboxymethyl-2-hydroxymuconate isomerase
MPHCVIYASEVLPNNVLSAVHQAMVESQLFSEDRIKVRVMSVPQMMTGGVYTPHCHIEVKLINGRTPQQKINLSQLIYKALKRIVQSQISIEVIDISDAYLAD